MPAPWFGIPGGWNVAQVVSGLYESADWTREQIADWVETVERQDEATPEPEHEAVTT